MFAIVPQGAVEMTSTDNVGMASTETVQESVPVPAESSGSNVEILFNPNVFTEFKLAGNEEASLES